MKKFIIIIFGLAASCLASYFIYDRALNSMVKKIRKLDLRKNKFSCNLTHGNDLQSLSCFRNFNASYPNDYFNYADTILEYSCNNGKSLACLIRSSIGDLATSTGAVRKNSQSLDRIIDNCSNVRWDENTLLNSRLDNNLYCSQLKEIANFTNDLSLLAISTSDNCRENLKTCLDQEPYYIFASTDHNQYLQELYCNISPINPLFCSKLSRIISFQQKFVEIFYNAPYGKRLPSNIFKICKQFPDECKMAFTQPIYFSRLIVKSNWKEEENKLHFFDKFELNFESAWFLNQSVEQGDTSTNFKNKALRYLRLHQNDKLNVIKSECQLSDEKSYCFLSFKKLGEARANYRSLELFCQKGDDISCSYLTIIDNSKNMNLKDDRMILNYFLNWEYLEVEAIKKEPVHIFIRTINNFRFTIIVIFTVIFVFLAISFVFWANKLDELLRYLKMKRLEELKNKINKKLE